MQVNISDLFHQYFDKIFVITLKRASDRQERTKKLLQGLNYEFYFGVDKNDLVYMDLEKRGIYNDKKAKELDRYGKGITLGGIACSLSHRNLYQLIIEKGYHRVLIFEDDVVPLKDNLLQLPNAIKELPDDWELVYLGYTKHEKTTAELKLKQAFYKILSSASLMKWNRTMVDNLLPFEYSDHLKLAGYHDCTHAYGVTRSALQKLITNQTPVILNSDDLLSYVVMNGNLKAFITQPKFFDQEHFANFADKSYIHD